MFKPLSDNEALIKQRRLIKNHRDLCAHQGFFLSHQKQQQQAEQDGELDAFLSEAETGLQMLKDEMQQIGERLQQEYRRLEAEQALPDMDIVPPLFR